LIGYGSQQSGRKIRRRNIERLSKMQPLPVSSLPNYLFSPQLAMKQESGTGSGHFLVFSIISMVFANGEKWSMQRLGWWGKSQRSFINGVIC
jgi:hypothetical protein